MSVRSDHSQNSSSSNDIIKKAEDEIASAQRAAAEANHRLSLAFPLTLRNDSDSFDSSSVQKSPTEELDDILDKDIKDMLSVSMDEEDNRGLPLVYGEQAGDEEQVTVGISYAPPVDRDTVAASKQSPRNVSHSQESPRVPTGKRSPAREAKNGSHSNLSAHYHDHDASVEASPSTAGEESVYEEDFEEIVDSDTDYTEETVDEAEGANFDISGHIKVSDASTSILETEIVFRESLDEQPVDNRSAAEESEYTEEEVSEEELKNILADYDTSEVAPENDSDSNSSSYTEETVTEDDAISRNASEKRKNRNIDTLVDPKDADIDVSVQTDGRADSLLGDDSQSTRSESPQSDSPVDSNQLIVRAIDSEEKKDDYNDNNVREIYKMTSLPRNEGEKAPNERGFNGTRRASGDVETKYVEPDSRSSIDAREDDEHSSTGVDDHKSSTRPLSTEKTDLEVSASSFTVPKPENGTQVPGNRTTVMASWKRSTSPLVMRVPSNSNPSSRASSPVLHDDERESIGLKDIGGAPSATSHIEFRNPYPLPPPIPRPRSSVDIIKDAAAGMPRQFTGFSRPRVELEKLLKAAMGKSLQRRSNACGALKVLSLKPRNRLTLVRTDGFLDAIVFAIKEIIPQSKEFDVALDARGRAVTTLLNVSEPKDNRTMIMAHDGVGEALTLVVREDQGEARVHALAVLAMLAKTPPNREFMVKLNGLIDTLAMVLTGEIDRNRPPVETTGEKQEGGNEHTNQRFRSGSFSSSEDQENISFDISSRSNTTKTVVEGKVSTSSIKKLKHEKYSEFLMKSRVNSCAVLSHLSKHCAISDKLADNEVLIDGIVDVCREFDNPIHTKCIEIICNLSRFPSNNASMARNETLVDTLVKCGKSKTLEDRIWAIRTFQNMASDSTSKVLLATGRILTLLSICSMRKDYDEQLAAVAALYNLSTEPGAVVPLTNTKNVVATLVHLAHNAISTPEIRQMACDALATIGLWLQTLAGSGTVPVGVPKVLLPSHQTTGWQRWD